MSKVVFGYYYVAMGYNFVLYLFEPDVISVIKLSCISYFVTVVFFRIVMDTCYFAR